MSDDKEQNDNERITAAILVIGDEILSGRTKDLNIGYMACHFTEVGIELREARIVADKEKEIIEAINALRARYTYVFTTGGIGPTHDDITADAIAKAFGIEIDIDERALALMKAYYAEGEITEARLRMTRIPKGAELVDNAISAAPGFWIDNVIVMAGVPGIMQVMLDSVTPKLKTGRKMNSVTIDLDQPESTVAKLLGEHQKQHPEISMGSYPHYNKGKFTTQLVLRSTDEKQLKNVSEILHDRLKSEGAKFRN